jgi:hypothetical protein
VIRGKESHSSAHAYQVSSGTRYLVVILELSPDSEDNAKIISRSRS